MRHKMRRIKAKRRKVETYEIDKISLPCFDDKRFVLKDGIHTLAYFQKDLRKKRIIKLIKKKRFSQIKRIQKRMKNKILTDKKKIHRWLQIKISACK